MNIKQKLKTCFKIEGKKELSFFFTDKVIEYDYNEQKNTVLKDNFGELETSFNKFLCKKRVEILFIFLFYIFSYLSYEYILSEFNKSFLFFFFLMFFAFVSVYFIYSLLFYILPTINIKNKLDIVDFFTRTMVKEEKYVFVFKLENEVFFVKLNKLQNKSLNENKIERLMTLEELKNFFIRIHGNKIDSNIQCVISLNDQKLCFIKKDKDIKEDLPFVYKNLHINEKAVLDELKSENCIIFEIDKKIFCDNIYFEEVKCNN